MTPGVLTLNPVLLHLSVIHSGAITVALLFGDATGRPSMKEKINNQNKSKHHPHKVIFCLLSPASLLIHKSPGHPVSIPSFYSLRAMRRPVGDGRMGDGRTSPRRS